MSDRKNEDERRKPGRFAWVKKLMQSKNSNVSHKSTSKTVKAKESELFDQRENHHPQPNHHEEEGRTLSSKTREETDSERQSQQRAVSLSPDSIKNDNTSTLPVISLSTMSVRSSTFSEHSLQSTSATVTSEHPTVFTNASTMGIPPASIMDRRVPNLAGYLYSTNNSSNHTFNTAMSPLSEPDFEH